MFSTLKAFFRADILHEFDNPFGFLSPYLFVGLNITLFYSLHQWVQPVQQDLFSFFVQGWSLFLVTHRGLEKFVREIRREMSAGTLEMGWASGVSTFSLLGGIALWPFINGFLQMGLAMILGGILTHGVVLHLFGIHFWIAATLGILLYFLIGLVIGSQILMTRRGNSVVTFLSYLGLVLSGVFFPVTALPQWLQFFSSWFPLTHLLKIARGESWLNDPAGIIIFTFLILSGLLGMGLLRYAFWRIRRDGTLAYFASHPT